MASSKPVTSNTPKRKTRDILHDLEEIRKKLQENFTWKEAHEEQQQGELILLGERGLKMEVGGNDKNNDKWLSVGGIGSQSPAGLPLRGCQ